jgi:hypothetical protein
MLRFIYSVFIIALIIFAIYLLSDPSLQAYLRGLFQ